MSRAVLSIGSNLGERLEYLRMAAGGLGDALRAASGVYETSPWGVTDQPVFLNAVLIVDDAGHDPRDWLERARRLEREAERVRERRWGPRSLDVDIVTVDGIRSDDPELTLPHPMAHLRAFVLLPWSEVEPDSVLPGKGAVADLVTALDVEERDGVRRLEGVGLR